jgi:hypothetical protein
MSNWFFKKLSGASFSSNGSGSEKNEDQNQQKGEKIMSNDDSGDTPKDSGMAALPNNSVANITMDEASKVSIDVSVKENTGQSLMKNAIAQCKAIAGQDAVHFLGQTETVSNTAIAVLTQILVANYEDAATVKNCSDAIAKITENLTTVASAYQTATKNIATGLEALEGKSSSN